MQSASVTRCFAFCCIVLALHGCGGADKASGGADSTSPTASLQAGDTANQAAVEVKTEVARSTEFIEELEVVGTVAPRTGKVAQLAAPSATRVVSVPVTTGAHVKAGATLVEFDVAPLEAQSIAADRALDAAQKANDRAKRLTEAGVLPRKDAEAAAVDLALAEANAIAAHRAREHAVLRAPFDGVVMRQLAILGSNADPSQPLVEIADPVFSDILLTVSPQEASRLRVGQSVSFQENSRLAKVGEPQIARGTIADVGAVVDSLSGGVSVRVKILDRSRILRFGEVLAGRISLGVQKNAVVIPESALVPNGEGYRVFVVDSSGIAHATDVEIGSRSTAGVWIVVGVKAGETVVTEGAYGMDDMAKVESVKK